MTKEQLRTQETAELITIIDDQGGGISYCGSCNTEIDLREVEVSQLNPLRCPNPKCDKIMIFTESWLSPGGSDF